MTRYVILLVGITARADAEAPGEVRAGQADPLEPAANEFVAGVLAWRGDCFGRRERGWRAPLAPRVGARPRRWRDARALCALLDRASARRAARAPPLRAA